MIEYKGNIAYGDKLLCDGIDVGVKSGDCILLCGANGSGKSTLLRTLAKENPALVSMIPTGIPKVKGFDMHEFIRLGCDEGGRGNSKDSEKRMAAVLRQLGLEKLQHRDISTLSDGEFQKACIAIALCSGKEILLLDEPTAFLDPGNRTMILSCLREICSAGQAVVFSSHDIELSLN